MGIGKRHFGSLLILALLIAASTVAMLYPSSAPLDVRVVTAQGIVVEPEKSLLIRDLAVIEDPNRTFNPCTGEGTPLGKWTFGYLMTELANEPVTGLNPANFTRNWLRQWGTHKNINGDIVLRRPEQLIQRPWEEAGNGVNQPLDLSIAPFRLLAIVNRIDLKDDHVLGGVGAGEARFVFGAVDLENNCQPLPFTVIFEFGIKREGCQSIQDWAWQWQDLAQFEIGSEAYNAALEQITEQFAAAGSDPDMRPNQSSLNTLLSNENFLGTPFELRAFKLVESGRARGLLDSVPLNQTPADRHNRTALLVDFINANEASILAKNYDTPLMLPDGTPFLGGGANMVASTRWNGPQTGPFVNSNDARHIFSLNTCSGCHARETGTGFFHIRPAPFGTSPNLSGFLTGIDVLDPQDRVTIRHFSDLARRAQEFEVTLATPCAP
jgi:hypothetical protein